MTEKPKEPAVKINRKAWQKGYEAGLTGEPPPDLAGLDGFSYVSGLIEGKADKAKPPKERKPPQP